jgi:phosphoesterase RecJ-like protein
MSDSLPRIIPEKLIFDIHNYSHVVLFTHSHPDGDALGSLLGFASILESLGKKVFCLIEEPISHLYTFLPEKDRVSISVEQYKHFVSDAGEDLVSIALDCGDEDRLGLLKQEVLSANPFWVIDHHQSHTDFGTGRWVDPLCSSTGEMVYELGMLLGAELSVEAAFNLYVAICTDTGSFRYECTGPRTMEIAGQLIEKGVKPHVVGSHIYDNFTKQRIKLMELALGSIALYESEQIAFMSVTQSMLQQSGANLQDAEGFIDYPRSLQTVKVAVLVKEALNGTVSVSLRAKGQCNVASVAKQFGGGGHRNAAGFRCHGKAFAQVQDEVLGVLKIAVTTPEPVVVKNRVN